VNGLIVELQRQYQMVIYRYEPYPNGFWLETNQGIWFLHYLPPAFADKSVIIEKIHKELKGEMILPIVPTRDGRSIISLNERTFYMTKWVRYESDWVDYRSLAHALAHFHKLSCECTYESGLFAKHRGFDTWAKAWKARVKHLERIPEVLASREKVSEFDAFVIENHTYFSNLGTSAISYLEDSNYSYVCGKSKEFGRICHVNFGYDQFVTTAQGKTFFTQPFSWIEDMRVRDLGHFIKAHVREYGWNAQQIYQFLAVYHSISPILPEEFTVMYAMFLLPGRMMKKMEYLYGHKESFFGNNSNELELDLFKLETSDLNAKVAYQEVMRNEVLLVEFPRLIEDTFGVVLPRVPLR
jgi:CotS family spore coat protein